MATFGWCLTGHHDQCRRSIQKFVWVEATRKKKAHIQMLDEYSHCECSKRGCKCFVRKADRAKRKRKT